MVLCVGVPVRGELGRLGWRLEEEGFGGHFWGLFVAGCSVQFSIVVYQPLAKVRLLHFLINLKMIIVVS